MEAHLRRSDGSTVPVRDGLVIGRHEGCGLTLDDTKASRRHARLLVAGGVVEIEDLESSNGTLLNGVPVTRRMLRDGDEVQVGRTVLTFVEAKAAAPSVAEAGDDDVDLFGEEDTADEKAVPAPAPPSTPPPAPAPAPSPPPTAPSKQVLEFEDEVVEVSKPEPARPGRGDDEPVVEKKERILQYSRQPVTGSMLGDDLAQMGGLQKAVVIVFAVAGAVGLAWLVMELVAG